MKRCHKNNCLPFVLIFLVTVPLLAQIKDKKVLRHFNRAKDKLHSGVGLILSMPQFGNRTKTEKPWMGYNVHAFGADLKLSFGEVQISDDPAYNANPKDAPPFSGERAAGTDFSLGISLPVTLLRIGIQNSMLGTCRIHPVANAYIGAARLRKITTANPKSYRYYYMGGGIGVRFRLPVVTIEPQLNTNIGMHEGRYDRFRIFSWIPSITMRLDANMLSLKPTRVRVHTANWNIDNLEIKDNKSYYYNRKTGAIYEHTETTTSYDVSTSSGSSAIWDIGGFLGIGPKISTTNLNKIAVMPRGILLGVNAVARSRNLYLGFNIEGGRLGHASTSADPLAENRFKTGVHRGRTYARGAVTMTNAYFDFGLDVGPYLLSLMGTVREPMETTSFVSVVGGYSFGMHIKGQQQFDDEAAAVAAINYNAYLYPISKYTDAREGKSGYLGGFFLNFEVGVVAFRMQWLRFTGMPIANTTFYSIAYRVPIRAKN